MNGGLFDRYEQLQELGAGGQARVVLARDRWLERLVALKLLLTNDRALVRRLVHEARITARCQHNNVVMIYEVGYQNGCPYIVLEYLHGKPLTALLENAWRLPYARAIEILVPVLRALQHIHEVGVVHRDLKPDNVFVTESGLLKLLDFGIAKVLQRWSPQVAPEDAMASTGQLTQAGMMVGTYQYMSPEQWRMETVDHLTDIWACGILLYRMICGHHPLHPLDGRQLLITAMFEQPMPPMSEAAPADVPLELSAIVDRCLFKIKEQRWPSASALLAALLPFLPVPVPADNVERHSDAATLMVDTEPFSLPPAKQPAEEDFQEAIMERAAYPDMHPHSLGAGGSVVAPPSNDARSQQHLHSVARQPDAVAEQPATVLQQRPRRNPLLFVAADPVADPSTDHGTLGQQMNAIRVELERTPGRESFELVPCLAPEPLDLLRYLRKHAPQVVYFVGSGQQAGERVPGQALAGGAGGLYFRGPDGRPRFVTSAAIEATFGAVGASVKLVVLDRCYSTLQAKALLRHVECVVGTPGTAGTAAAKGYALGFFGGLGEHQSIAAAHKQGCAAIRLMDPQEDDPQGDDPAEIMVREGVDADRLVLAPAAP